MWSWVLSGTGLLALWLLGNKSHWGFIVGLLSDALWAVYSIDTHQWGFVVACVVYMFMHVRNLRRWRKNEDEPKSQDPVDDGSANGPDSAVDQRGPW